jgi:hypothetical protein
MMTMDTARMRPGDYPAIPERWQVAAGPGDLRYGVQARRYEYMSAQCRYCGSSCPGPANGIAAHPKAACLACGTPQCGSSGGCLVCMIGFVGGAPWSSQRGYDRCGYSRCDGQAVAKAPRAGRACLMHLMIAKSRGQALADQIASCVRLRDRGGRSWQKIAWFGPAKRYYVRRWSGEPGSEGWVGPLDTAGQADREAGCWREAEWEAERVEATPEVTEQVNAWQAAADRKLGRTVRR